MTAVLELGVVTPVVTRLPRAHAPWERDATVDELAAIARAADRLGYHHLTCSEHVAVPVEVAEVRGATYWDPAATLGYLAAATERIRLATHVLVLGYHHPLEIAKTYGTLDRLSGGRVILGVGVGSLREEFDLLGAPFDDRGNRGDDALRALRASLSQEQPRYEGSHYRFDGLVVDPAAVQQHLPIWVGGRTARSLRRALTLGDGWVPFGLGPDDLGRLVARARHEQDLDARSHPFAFVLWPDRSLDPMNDPDDTQVTIARYRDLGTTHLNCRFRSESAAHYLEQLEAMVQLRDAG